MADAREIRGVNVTALAITDLPPRSGYRQVAGNNTGAQGVFAVQKGDLRTDKL